MKHALKQIEGGRIQRAVGIEAVMASQAIVQGMVSVMDVKLGIGDVPAWKRENGASLMDEFTTQDIGVRATTTPIDRMVSLLANRSHGQGIVVEKDELMKGKAKRTGASEKAEKFWWHLLKGRKRDLALIAAHAKLGIDVGGGREGLNPPMKGMARRALDVHLAKAMNLPSRVKRSTCNGKVQRLWRERQWKWGQLNDMIK